MAKYRSGLTAYADGQVDPEQALNPAIDRNWDAGPGGKLLTKTLAGDVDLTRDEVQASGVLLFDGSPGAGVTVDFPQTDTGNGWHGERLVYVVNATADSQDITFRFDNDGDDVADGDTVTVSPGLGAWLRVKDPDVDREALLDLIRLPEIGAADGAADYGVVWDSSARALRRLLLDSWPGSGGGEGGTSIVAGAWKTIETRTLTGVAQADFNLPSGYEVYVLTGWLRPDTDNIGLRMRLSDDGGTTFKSGASDYRWAKRDQRDYASSQSLTDSGDAQIDVGSTFGNPTADGGSFVIEIHRALDGSRKTLVTFESNAVANTFGMRAQYGHGQTNFVSADDAVRLLLSSGNIAEGEIKLIGLKSEAESIALGEPRGALVDKSATQSIPNSAFTALTFDQEVYDTDGFHDNATNNSRLTVPAGVGWVRLTAQADFVPNSSGNRQLVIWKNGSEFVGGAGQSGPGHGNNWLTATTAPLQVAAGDYFEMYVFQDTGAGLNVEPSSTNQPGTWFAVEVVERTSAEDTKVLAGADPAGVSEVDFNLDNANYETFELVGWLEPTSGSPELWLRVSDDGGATFKNGASDYMYAWRWQNDAPNGGTITSGGAAQLVLMTFVDEAVAFKARIARAGLAKTTSVHVNGEKPNATSFLSNDGGGSYTGTEVIDAVRLLFDGVNIAAGHIALIGIKGS